MVYYSYMSFLDSIKDIFSGLEQGKAGTYVGIDIGSSFIKIVQAKKDNGRLVLETYGEVALGPYDNERFAGELTNLEPEKMVEAIKNLLEQANVTAKNAVISVSSATSLIFILKLPKIKDSELDSVVKNEARKYIPVPLTEVSLDWWIIPEKEIYSEEDENSNKNKTKDIDVLVAAVRNEVVERYNKVTTMLGKFTATEYEIETFSAIRASFKHELAPVMLVDFGASGTRVSVIEHGVVRKFHSINRGSAYLSSSLQKSLQIEFNEAEKLKREVGLDNTHQNQEAYNIILAGTNYIFSEVKNVLFDFEKEYKKPVHKIILTGGGSRLINFKDQLESKYDITTVHADPFDKIMSPDFLEEVLKQAGPEFVVAVGLALQGLE
jgi:type IV pilus assembly protein PilM